MKNFFLKTGLTLLCLIIGLGSAWGETYTIDFNKGTTNGTSISTQLASSVGTMCSSGAMNASSITGTNCYYNTNGCGLRLAKKDGNGSLRITFSDAIQSATVQKVIVYASAAASGNTLEVTPAGTVITTTKFSDLNTYSTSNSASTNYQLSEITINGTLTSLDFYAVKAKYVMLHRIDIITGAAKTLQSITVSGTPTRTTYEVGETFDPTGLTVTGTYSEGDPEIITEGIDWTISPNNGTLSVGQTSINVVATVGNVSSDSYQVNGLTVTAPLPKITITDSNINDFTTKYKEYTWTDSNVSGKLYAYKTNGMQFNTSKDGYYVYNTDPIPGNIRSIKITTHTNGTEREWKVSVGTSQITSISGDKGTEDTKLVSKSGTLWTISGNNQYFCLVDNNGASNISEIVITYEESTTPPTPSISADDKLEIPAAGTDGTFNVTWTGMEDVDVNLYNDVDCTEDFTDDWFDVELDDDNNVYYLADENTSTSPRTVYMQLYGVAADGTTDETKVVTVTQAGATPVYASLAALVADGAPTATAKKVTVTLTNETITRKVSNGIFVQVGDKEIELYKTGLPSSWQVGGTISGTLTNCTWQDYYGTWELCPTSWDELSYTAPLPNLPNFIKNAAVTVYVGHTYNTTDYLNIPADYDCTPYTITTTIDGLTEKDGEYACAYPYVAFQTTGKYTVHVVAPATDKYAQTEGDIEFTVINESVTYNVTIDNTITNGTVTADPTTASEGEIVTLTVTPATGYTLGTLTVTNATTSAPITVTDNTFTMPAADVNVTATFEEEAAPGSYTYNLVTDASTLAAGDVIVLGCAAKGKAAGAMGTGAFFTSVDATISDGVLSSKDVIEITLDGSAGAWTLTTSEGQITTSAAKALKLNNGTQKTWTISISGGTATITGGSYGDIQYNSGSPRFCNYTSSQSAIEIYKKTAAETKTLTRISLDGQTTEFTEGDNFAFGGTVTAHYDDESTKNVTTSATFSGYDMSILDTEQTVTVSYTEGGVTQEASYTITVVSLPRYTVTIVEPENGTLVVKDGETPIVSGASVKEGTTLTIEATPAEGYVFKNWQYKKEGGSWETKYKNFDYTVESNVSFRANFEELARYTVTFDPQAGTCEETSLEETVAGAGVTLPAAICLNKDYEFAGWATEVCEETTTMPTLYDANSPYNPTSDITLYAVYSKESGEVGTGGTYTLDYADEGLKDDTNWGSYGTAYTYTAKDGSTWVIKANNQEKDGMLINSDKNASIKVPVCPANITTIEIDLISKRSDVLPFVKFSTTDYTGSSMDASYIIGSVQDATPVSIDLSAQNINTCYIYAPGNAQIIKKITVNYGASKTTTYDSNPCEFLELRAIDNDETTRWATYSNDENNVEFIEGATVYSVTAENGKIVLHTEENIVPKQTGVLLQFTGDEVRYVVAESANSLKNSNNMLHPSSEDMSGETGYIFYKLAYSAATHKDLGFYYAATDGAWFTSKPNLAYLAVPASQGEIRGFAFDDALIETGINTATTTVQPAANTYDLQGRLTKANTHGLFIVNGKKIIK